MSDDTVRVCGCVCACVRASCVIRLSLEFVLLDRSARALGRSGHSGCRLSARAGPCSSLPVACCRHVTSESIQYMYLSFTLPSAHPACVLLRCMPAPLPARKTPRLRAARHGRLRLFAAAMGLVGDEGAVSHADSTSLSSLQRELREDIDAREACALVVSISTHSGTDSSVRPRATHALLSPACSVTAALLLVLRAVPSPLEACACTAGLIDRSAHSHACALTRMRAHTHARSHACARAHRCTHRRLYMITLSDRPGPQGVTLPQAYAVLQLVSPIGAKRLFDAIVPLQR